jgi:hypothetical protein
MLKLELWHSWNTHIKLKTIHYLLTYRKVGGDLELVMLSEAGASKAVD